jgi:bifunctional non-homologous end joining protein LigD
MPTKSTASLDEYQSKRDFSKTKEPSGKTARSRKSTALRFLVQKHDATRLHYDFRIELDGVLKSWAVTKGPSDNPEDKRLAVRVEDHPLDYGSFEGTIPEGEYGGGTVMLWDEGTWEPIGDPHAALEAGDLKMRIKGKRMKGEWVLVHMKGRDSKRKSGPDRENWLLIKHKDDYARDHETLTERFTKSVSTGRDLDGIAKGLKSRKASKTPRAAVWHAKAHQEQPNKRTKSSDAKPLYAEAGINAAEAAGIKLTSPERVVFPGQGVTKADLVAYYAAVAERMLPYIERRPLSLLRCPQGRTKYCFFQKHDTGGFPDAMKTVQIAEKDGDEESYFYVEDLAGLIAGTQMNVLEWHLWGARIKDVEKPERIIFDIDPDEGLGFDHVRQAAIDIRDVLGSLDLQGYALVSGGKGIHVIAPLRPSAEWPEVKQFCKALAQRLADAYPDRFTANIRKAQRKGRLFIDYLRNERGSTAIAPWSIRSRQGAPAAVPVSWDELEMVKAANQFTLTDAAERATGPDPWKDYFATTQSITQAMLSAVEG